RSRARSSGWCGGRRFSTGSRIRTRRDGRRKRKAGGRNAESLTHGAVHRHLIGRLPAAVARLPRLCSHPFDGGKMRIAKLPFLRYATVVVSAAVACACGGLAHPLSNDGHDVGNPNGANTGATPTLSLSADSTSIGVGSGVAIHVYYNQSPLTSTSIIT